MYRVYLFDKVVGQLTPRGQGVQFRYSEAALKDAALPAISLSLPKSEQLYGGKQARSFFSNLLPEGAYKRLVESVAGVAAGNERALLGAIGGECPGAISIWPEKLEPPTAPAYDRLDDEGLKQLFNPGNTAALAQAVQRGRLSLPGVQEKIALFRDDQGWWLPLNGAITSHILKEPDPGFPGLLENELFCMLLAKKAGLGIPETGLPRLTVRALCSERFDRPESGGKEKSRRKLHQEDFCQILGVLPTQKYQAEGGPGIKQCAAVIREHSALPAIDLIRLLHWVGFNYLIGNEDAHAKNLAMLYGGEDTSPKALRLAPFYDLISTQVYELDRRAAMKIGAAEDLRNVQTSDWKRVGEVLDLPWNVVREELQAVAKRTEASLAEAQALCVGQTGAAEVYENITRIVNSRIKSLERQLARPR